MVLSSILPNKELDFSPDNLDDDTNDATDNNEKLPAHMKCLMGINGETCYVMISDTKSGSIKIAICRNKSLPREFFRAFIANYKLNVPGCKV